MRTLLSILCLCALAVPSLATAEIFDKGVLTSTVGGRPLGVETFTFERYADSLVVRSELYQTIQSAQGADSVRKQMALVLSSFDMGLRIYRSSQEARGHTWSRMLIPRDSTLSSFREFDLRGEADIHALPPGRLFVMEGGLFSLFDVMTRSLAGKTFTSRPLTAIALGPRDSVLEVAVRDLGTDTLRWGGRPVVTRKLEFSDGRIHYDVWADSQGRMLRLVQPDMRVQVDRQPPAIKRRAPRPRAR